MRKEEKARKALEESVREARAVLESRRAALWAADLEVAQIGGDTSWSGKHSARRAKGGAESARAAMKAALEDLAQAEEALVGFMADREMAAKSDFKAWSAWAQGEATRLTALFRQRQAGLVETGKDMATLLIAAQRKAPRRIISRRSSVFVRVEPTEEKFRELYKDADPPGTFSIELFRAQRGEAEGKWKILPGQSVDTGEVEVVWADGVLPAEVEAISDLNLGRLFAVNGDGGELKGKVLNVDAFARLVVEEDVERVAKEGVLR